VFWIAAAEILADLRVGSLPETGQVVGHLLGTVIGAQEMEKDSDTATGYSRRFGYAKEVLDPHGEDRGLARFIDKAVSLALDLNMRGGKPIDLANAIVADHGAQPGQPIGPRQFIERSEAVTKVWQHRDERPFIELRKVEIREHSGEPLHARQEHPSRGFGWGHDPSKFSGGLAA
jgi:hypothetical protein